MSKLVLWGHHVNDYQEMFDLSQTDLKESILEYGCGPSAFNAELQGIAKQCISCDPLFCLDEATLKSKTALIFNEMLNKIKTSPNQFNFEQYNGLTGLVKKRQAGIEEFFDDYAKGKKEERYVCIQAVQLPFADFTFDFAVSSHYLFASLEGQSVNFHIEVIKELARVAREVRIFPLIADNGEASPCLGPVLLALQRDNYGTEVRSVAYHLQDKGNAMLRIWAHQCVLA